MTCETCWRELEVGDWPFCPHGRVGNFTNFKDDIPGGMVLENYGPHPITVYSHTERERVMKAAGLHLKEKFCPMPGTDIDPQGIPNPKGYMDPYTLANATELICRNGQKTREFDAVEDGVMEGFFDGHLTSRDARAIAGGDKNRMARLGRRIKDGRHTGS